MMNCTPRARARAGSLITVLSFSHELSLPQRDSGTASRVRQAPEARCIATHYSLTLDRQPVSHVVVDEADRPCIGGGYGAHRPIGAGEEPVRAEAIECHV